MGSCLAILVAISFISLSCSFSNLLSEGFYSTWGFWVVVVGFFIEEAVEGFFVGGAVDLQGPVVDFFWVDVVVEGLVIEDFFVSFLVSFFNIFFYFFGGCVKFFILIKNLNNKNKKNQECLSFRY